MACHGSFAEEMSGEQNFCLIGVLAQHLLTLGYSPFHVIIYLFIYK
jgi:hypothetical protein